MPATAALAARPRRDGAPGFAAGARPPPPRPAAPRTPEDTAAPPSAPERARRPPGTRTLRCRKAGRGRTARASPAPRPPWGVARARPARTRFPPFRRKQRTKLWPAVHFVSIQALETGPRWARVRPGREIGRAHV